MNDTTLQQVVQTDVELNQLPCPVNSYNSWDPLEEAIVGRLDGATIPPNHPIVTFNIPQSSARMLKFFGGLPYPRWMIKKAQKQLDEFIHILKAEGVTVRQPDRIKFSAWYKTLDWSSRGFCIACPRDGFIVIGNEIIETPMAWRSRFFETYAYRSLFKEYFAKGARWTSAPRPQLLDSLYDSRYSIPTAEEPMRYVINESELVFDAADFIRCGKDIFVQKSNVTNELGITWMRRHLGEQYQIHEIETKCRTPMHIDSTFMPLAPGKLLINPDYIDPAKLPVMFKSWDIIVAPKPEPNPSALSKRISQTSNWISLNMLMLDEQRVIVERHQTSMIQTLKNYGFKPISCSFYEYSAFGGSFHCATLDVRRRGTLQSYF